jgi:hypothetical protein
MVSGLNNALYDGIEILSRSRTSAPHRSLTARLSLIRRIWGVMFTASQLEFTVSEPARAKPTLHIMSRRAQMKAEQWDSSPGRNANVMIAQCTTSQLVAFSVMKRRA